MGRTVARTHPTAGACAGKADRRINLARRPRAEPVMTATHPGGAAPAPSPSAGVGHYENFPVASWLCPPALRPAAQALYHFARTADDMLAYLAAQYCDVQLFHFWKRLTKGKHLWLRNNFSTLISQGVDSFMVISVTFGAAFLAGAITLNQLLVLMGSNYLFKMLVALLDTLPFYLAVRYLRHYLHVKDEIPM